MPSVYSRFRRLVLSFLILALTNMALALPANAIGIVRDAEIEDLLRDMTDPIFEAAGLAPEDVELYLVNDASLNAFVSGGKNIFIHTGLIIEAERPMELQGVLAHETGHITGGHLARMSDGAARANIPMFIGLAGGLVAALAGAPDLGMWIMAGGQHAGQMEFLAFNRTQESAADQASLTFTDRAGISPDGLLAFHEKFRHLEVYTYGSGRIPPYWRTHPLSSHRISTLKRRAEASPHKGKLDDPEIARRFELMRGKLIGFVNEPYVTMRLFPVEDTSAKARYARAIAYFRSVDIDEALAEVDSLIAEEENNPYFRELKGQILFESGRVAESIPHHQLAVNLSPEEPLLRVNLAQAMISLPDSDDDAENTARAKEQLEIALAADDTNSFAYYQLAIAYAREGNEGLADLATAERYYYGGDIAGATNFAGRARNKLEKGTPAWQRASDILNVARNAMSDRKRRGYADAS